MDKLTPQNYERVYEAYADYHSIMDRTEAWIQYIAQKVNNSLEIELERKKNKIWWFWARVTWHKALKIISYRLGIQFQNRTCRV